MFAGDPTKSLPYATLKVKIAHATGLLNDASVNERFDKLNPYVLLSVDGDQKAKTEAKKNTQAPVWNETLEVEIFHPMSILTLQVYDSDLLADQDITGAFSQIELKLTEDDHIGYIDLVIGVLPNKERRDAWFTLTHPDNFADTLKNRLARKLGAGSTFRSSGRMFVELELVIENPRDELFAMCLYKPSRGHGLEPLDISGLFADVTECQRKSKRIRRTGKLLLKLLRKYSTPVCMVALLALSNSLFIVPFYIAALWFFMYVFDKAKRDAEEKEEKHREEASGTPQETISQALQIKERFNHLRALVLDTVGTTSLQLLHAKQKEDAKQKEVGLRNLHKQVRRAKWALDRIEDALKTPWRCILLPFFSIAITVHLLRGYIWFVLYEYGVYAVRVGLAIIFVCVSFVGRTLSCVYLYYVKHPRARGSRLLHADRKSVV